MVWATSPFLKTIIVGMARTWYLAAVSWFSSTLSLTMRRSSRSCAISSSTGATTRQGPHQGAQKSTSTGVSDSMTSAWKFASVTSLMLAAMGCLLVAISRGWRGTSHYTKCSGRSRGRAGALHRLPSRHLASWWGGRRPAAQAGNEPRRLERDPPGHLRTAVDAVAKDDGQLDDAEARRHGAIGQLDLERVAHRAHLVEADGAQHLGAKALEAARGVGDVEAQPGARVPRPTAAEQAPQRAPVGHRATGRVARAQGEVGAAVADGGQQPREVRGVVGEVGVHLEHEARAVAQRSIESGLVGGPEPFAPGPVQHAHLAGAAWRGRRGGRPPPPPG